MIKSSLSWRLTRPIRGLGYLFRDPGGEGYRVLKELFWALPPGVRNRLHGPRHRIVRAMRKYGGGTFELGGKGKKDLSWEEFSEAKLIERSAYRGVFVQLSTIPWHASLYQRPQHMALAMARLGYLVIFKTPVPGGDDVNGFREVADNVWITNLEGAANISGAVRSVYSTDSVIELDDLEHDFQSLIIYEYIDHIDPLISGDDANIKKLERLKSYAFSGGADIIVSSARALHREAVALVGEDKCVLVPNGVDVAHYRNSSHDANSVSNEGITFRRQYKIVVGYFGALAPWLWYDELTKLVLARSDIGFIFIGPDYYGGVSRLPTTENILYVGPVDYHHLPAYGSHFDVCLIPFMPGEVAKTTSPLKLFEYFAMEKPVVATSFMEECVAFPEVFHGDSAQSLSSAIDQALEAGQDPNYKASLRRLADENSWECRAEVLSAAIQSHLAEK